MIAKKIENININIMVNAIPNNTLDDNDYICKDIQVNKCFLSELFE